MHAKTFTALLLLIVCCSQAGAQWTRCGPYGAGGESVVGMDSLLFLGTSSGLYVSTDHGNSWGFPPSSDLSNGRSPAYPVSTNGSVVYVVSQRTLFRSTDRGVTWTDETNNLPTAVGSYSYTVTALFCEDSLVYLGTQSGRLLRSSNRGTSWAPIDSLLPDTWVRDITRSSNGSLLVGLGEPDGVYRSTDEGATWLRADSAAIPGSAGSFARYTTIWFSMPGHLMHFTHYLLAGTNRGPYVSTDEGQTWAAINAGITTDGAIQVRPSALTSATYFYATSNKIYSSVDAGTSWTEDTLHTVTNQDVASMAVMGSEVYAACTPLGVMKSTDGGQSFWPSNAGIMGAQILHVGILDSILFASCNRDQIYRSSDWGQTWEPTAPLPGLNPNNPYYGAFLAVEYTVNVPTPRTEKYILQTATGLGLFKSTDFGVSWVRADSGMGMADVNSLASFTTATGRTLLAGTSRGVALSTDDSRVWTLVKPSPSDSTVRFIAGQDGFFVAGTYQNVTYRSVNYGLTWDSVGAGRHKTIIDDLDMVGSTAYVRDWDGVYTLGAVDAAWSTFVPGISEADADVILPTSKGLLGAGGWGVYFLPYGGSSWNGVSWDRTQWCSDIATAGDFIMLGTVTKSVVTTHFAPLVTAVDAGPSALQPAAFELKQNWPNPCNPSTCISYTIASSKEMVAGRGEKVDVKLVVYDLLGREVAVLADGYQTLGQHTVVFNGSRLASGVYFYRLSAGGQALTRRLVLMK